MAMHSGVTDEGTNTIVLDIVVRVYKQRPHFYRPLSDSHTILQAKCQPLSSGTKPWKNEVAILCAFILIIRSFWQFAGTVWQLLSLKYKLPVWYTPELIVIMWVDHNTRVIASTPPAQTLSQPFLDYILYCGSLLRGLPLVNSQSDSGEAQQ